MILIESVRVFVTLITINYLRADDVVTICSAE